MATVTGEKVWIDGAFVDWADANVHILTHTLHYGLGVFEGIRGILESHPRAGCRSRTKRDLVRSPH